MIPSSANLPDNARWSDFDDDYTAGEREELRELKRKWEDGDIEDKELVVCFNRFARCHRWYYGGYSIFDGRRYPYGFYGNETEAWHEAAKEILRGVQ